MKSILRRCGRLLLLMLVIACAGCGTFLPEFVTLRPLQNEGAYELEIETTQRNELNIHSYGFDTYKRKHLLVLASKGPVIDGSEVSIRPWENMPHPIGTVHIYGDRLNIELQAPYWDADKKIYRFTDFKLNGTYKLREEEAPARERRSQYGAGPRSWPNQFLAPTPVGEPPLAAQLQR